MASLSSELKGDQIQQAISVSVLKQIQDSQMQQAQALIQMMRNAPGPRADGTGSVVNIGA